MHRLRVLAAAPAALAAAAACAAADELPVRSLLEMRQDKVVVQKWDTSCGAAALATILTHQFGDPVTEKEAAQAMLRRTDPLRVRHRGGFSLLDLKRYAEGRGFAADGYAELDLEMLVELAPAIVPIRVREYDHFVVFRGLKRGRVLLADPSFGNRTLSIAEFERVWNGRLGFAVTPRGAPAGNRLSARADDFLAPSDMAIRRALPAGAPR